MKASPLINNFSAGEFGPLASARVDLDRHKASLETCENYIPRVQGGITRREGTKYVASTKSNGKVRLEKFIFSNDQAYVLEFGENYVRFFTDGAQIMSGGNPVEVVTTYAAADLFELSFCQSNDILYIFHESYAPAKLIRSSDTAWGIATIIFEDGPYDSINPTSNIAGIAPYQWLRVPFATGAGISLTTGQTVAVVGAVSSGGLIKITDGAAQSRRSGDKVYITGIIGTTEANGHWTITVTSPTEFTLNGSVFVNAYGGGGSTQPWVFNSSDVGQPIRVLEGSTWGWARIVSFVHGGSVVVDIKSTFTNINDKTTWRIGAHSVGNYPSAGCFYEDRLFIFGPNQFIAGSKTGDYENFSPSAMNGTVADNNGVSFSLSSNDSSQARWIVSDEKGLLSGTTANEWLVKSADSTSPITPTSITAKKVTSFGSKSVQPVQAGKAAIFTQASGRKVREFNYFYDVDGFRAQDATQLAHHVTESGLVQMALQKQPEQVVWCVREDGELAAMTYERDIDGLRVAWHRHIIGGYGDAANNNAIVESVCVVPTSDNSYDEVWVSVKRYINGATKRYIEYIGSPFSGETEQEDAFFVDSGLTYDSPKTITGITKANPVVVTSAGHGFSNGDKVRFDEILGMSELNGNLYKIKNVAANTFELTDYDNNNIDSSAYTTYVSGGEVRKLVTSISGLGHLEGQTVQTLCDGANGGSYVVSAGAITIDDPAAVVHVGLRYNSDLKLPRLEAGSQDGTALGKTRRIHRLGIMLHRSLGLKIGENFTEMVDVEFQQGSDQLNQAAPLFSGIKSEEFSSSYDFENHICIRQDQPLPSTILAIMPQVVTQDR